GRGNDPRPPGRKGPIRDLQMSKRLFVGNLSFDTSEAELEEAFSQWGGSGATIPTNESGRPKGFGFIDVPDDQMDAAIAGMNGRELAGRSLTVNEARPRGDPGGGRAVGGRWGGVGGGGVAGAGAAVARAVGAVATAAEVVAAVAAAAGAAAVAATAVAADGGRR